MLWCLIVHVLLLFIFISKTLPTLALNENYIPFIGSIGFTSARGHEELILEPVKPNLGSVLQATTRSIKKPRRPRQGDGDYFFFFDINLQLNLLQLCK